MHLRARHGWRLILVLAAVAALAGVLMTLWNWVMPALFLGVHSLDYAHAVGLLVLSRMLFGGFRGHGGWRDRHQGPRCARMTAGEREAFRGRAAASQSSAAGE